MESAAAEAARREELEQRARERGEQAIQKERSKRREHEFEHQLIHVNKRTVSSCAHVEYSLLASVCQFQIMFF